MAACVLCSDSAVDSKKPRQQAEEMRPHHPLSPTQQRPSTASAFHYHLQPSSKRSREERWTLESAGEEEEEQRAVSAAARLSHTSPVFMREEEAAMERDRREARKANTQVREQSDKDKRKHREEKEEAEAAAERQEERREEEREKDELRKDRKGRAAAAVRREKTHVKEEEEQKEADSDRRHRRRSEREDERAAGSGGSQQTEEERERRRQRREQRRQRRSDSVQAGRSEEASEFSVEWQREEDESLLPPLHRQQPLLHNTREETAEREEERRRASRKGQEVGDEAARRLRREEKRQREKLREAGEERLTRKEREREHKAREKESDRERRKHWERGDRKRRNKHKEDEREQREERAERAEDKEATQHERSEAAAERSWEDELERERKLAMQPQHQHGHGELPQHHHDAAPSSHASTASELRSSPRQREHQHRLHQAAPSHQTEPMLHHHHLHVKREASSPSPSHAMRIAEEEAALLMDLPALRCPGCNHHYHAPHTHAAAAAASAVSSSPDLPLSSLPPLPSPTSAHLHQQHHALWSPFSLTSRLPRLLSCSHTFCTSCISEAAEKQQQQPSPRAAPTAKQWVSCPLSCPPTLVTAAAGGVLGLRLNDAVLQLLLEVREGGGRLHHRQHATRLSASLSLSCHLSSSASSLFCSLHPTHPLTLYCHDCCELICLACTSPLFSPHPASSSSSSHHEHRTEKKEETLIQWRQSSLASSLRARVEGEVQLIGQTVAELGRRMRREREREEAELREVHERMREMRQQLLGMLDAREQQLCGQLQSRRRRREEEVETERSAAAAEMNELHILTVKAQQKEHLDASRTARRIALQQAATAAGAEQEPAMAVRVNGLTRAELEHEEDEVREMRWISDVIRTFTLDRSTRRAVTRSAEREEAEEEKAQLRLEVSAVVDTVRQQLQSQCLLVEHAPLSLSFTSVTVESRAQGGDEVQLRWEASAADAVTEWQLDVMERRKPLREEGRAAVSRSRREQREERAERAVQEEIEGLGLGSIADCLPEPVSALRLSSSASSSSLSSPYARLYIGSGLSFSHPIAADTVYTFRLRAVNAVGPSAHLHSPPQQSLTSLLCHSYDGDSNGLSCAAPHLLRLAASSLHPQSSPPSSLVERRRETAVSTLSLPCSWLQADVGCSLVLTSYTLWDAGRADWRRRRLLRWRLLGSDDDRDWTLIEERRRGEGDASASVRGSAHYEVDVERSRSGGRGFRYFRIEQQGTNADDDYCLVLGGVELYGLLRQP